MRLGPYEVRVAMQDHRTVTVSASTADRSAPGTVPVCFLDERGRLLFAPSVTLKEEGGIRRGSAAVRGSIAWQRVRSIVVPPGDASATRQPVAVVPLRWGEPIAVNIPDSLQGGMPDYGSKEPRNALTRAFQLRAERDADGTARVALDVVSIDGMREFCLDLAAALLDPSGEVLASGHLSDTIRVESRAVERHHEIAMGKVREGAVPAFLAIGIAPGDVISAPMGSFWGTFMRTEAAFDVAALLASPDEGSRRTGLETLARGKMLNRTIHYAFLDDSRTRPAARDGRSALHTLLRPLAGSLVRIARESGPADLRADAARLLAYSEADGATEALRPLAGDGEPRVRETAAIGLTFLGQADHLELLRSMLARSPESNRPAPPWQTSRFDEDVIIALAHQHSDTAVDILGATLLGDLRGARLARSTGRKPAPAGLPRGPGRSGRHDLRASRPRGQPPRRPLARRGRRPDRRETRPGRALPPP